MTAVTHTEKLLKLREKPLDQPPLRQRWSNLTFLHWAFEPEEVQHLVPLDLDLWEGKAYVGLVPFEMRDIEFKNGLYCPTAHNFLETNVRTYVVGPDGAPAVWFLSLEASSEMAVLGGKLLLGLPYWSASMGCSVDENICYESVRHSDGSRCSVETVVPKEFSKAEPGTLEFWLFERYLLFSEKNRKIISGRIWHEPWRIAPCESVCNDHGVLTAAGLKPEGEPIAHFSRGVLSGVWMAEQVSEAKFFPPEHDAPVCQPI